MSTTLKGSRPTPVHYVATVHHGRTVALLYVGAAAATILVCAAIMLGLLDGDGGLAACQTRHSADTCLYTLR